MMHSSHISMTQSAIASKYGVSKSFLRSLLNNQFHIPELFHDSLKHYRLCKLSPQEFLAALHEGTVTQTVAGKDTEFAVIYAKCNPYTVKRASQVICSFRAAKDEIGLEPVVIVQILEK